MVVHRAHNAGDVRSVLTGPTMETEKKEYDKILFCRNSVVEYLTFNQGVAGSMPAGRTLYRSTAW